MKKMILSLLALAATIGANAQNVEVHDFKKFKVHVYTSAEAMGDVSILVEGKKELVMLEPQSFFKSIEEFNSYISKLDKPLVKVIANYHAGGLGQYENSKTVMVEPMVAFMQSPMAQGMLKNFAGAFKGAMDTKMVAPAATIPAVSKQKWAGVKFDFTAGAASDFPASSVNIGDKVYYTHFAPNRMHPSPMQLTSSEAVDAMLTELGNAKASGCELFVGSHGGVSTVADVEFLIDYLAKIKELKASNSDAMSFAKALKVAYPSLAGDENVEAIAANLY